jgi:hypothetical protein
VCEVSRGLGWWGKSRALVVTYSKRMLPRISVASMPPSSGMLPSEPKELSRRVPAVWLKGTGSYLGMLSMSSNMRSEAPTCHHTFS